MTAQNGALVLIKSGDGGSPEVFTTIGGLQLCEMLLNCHVLNATSLESGAWEELLAGAGPLSLHVSGNGLFTDTTSEETVRGYAFSGSANNYQFVFANGNYVTGPFMITSYQRTGHYDTEEIYALTLESAGTINFFTS